MTRYLSQALGAEEPVFTQSIQQLERAGGRPNADIRLSADAMQQVRKKIAELGLDPQDTTGPELYSALQQRLGYDEQILRQLLGIDLDDGSMDILSRVQQYTSAHMAQRETFALKQSVARRLLKKKVPKNVMKQLKYRSVESMLKHESPAHLLAAAAFVETAAWRKAFYDQYAKLQPSDFESRQIQVTMPRSKRWLDFSQSQVALSKRHIVSFSELGAVVLFPLEESIEGLALTTMLLLLHEINTMRAFSSYIKLQQVRPDFGAVAKQAVLGADAATIQIAGQAITWQTVHRYYAHFKDAYHPDIFEPHVQPEDLSWHQAEEALIALSPSFSFWRGTHFLAFLSDGLPVSCNMLDVALSYCNHLTFKDRIVHFVRDNLWQELLLKYLHQQHLSEALHQQLSRELVEETPLAD